MTTKPARRRPHAAAWSWLRGLHPAVQVAIVLVAGGLLALYLARGGSVAGLLPLLGGGVGL